MGCVCRSFCMVVPSVYHSIITVLLNPHTYLIREKQQRKNIEMKIERKKKKEKHYQFISCELILN